MDEIFEEHQRVVWPALLVMQRGREDRSASAVIAEVLALLRATRSRGDDELNLDRFVSPVPARQVIDWLHAVWQRLAAGNERDAVARRRSILEGILAASLSDDDKARLVTALDYLWRLSAAARVVRGAQGPLPTAIAPTQDGVMQRAYLRMAAFAAADLPVWLVGERGTELLWAAGLIHRMRGGSDGRIRVWDPSQERFAPSLLRFLADRKTTRGRGLTIVVRDVDQAPVHIQRQLHDGLMSDLRVPGEGAIMVTTGPFDLERESRPEICLELFAFLTSTRVEIPPLRQRIADLSALMGFFAARVGQPNLSERMTAEASGILAAYHWPGNTEELESAVAFMARRRPSGPIRPEDLPDTVGRPSSGEGALLEQLELLHRREGFRVLGTDSGRRSMARFLGGSRDTAFDAVEFQAAFHLGRETARRLLQCLMECGLIAGIKGPQGKRTTRYRRCEGGLDAGDSGRGTKRTS